MTFAKRLNKLVKEVCRREGLKKQTQVGQVREILKCLAVIEAAAQMSDDSPGLLLREYSEKASIARKAKKV